MLENRISLLGSFDSLGCTTKPRLDFAHNKLYTSLRACSSWSLDFIGFWFHTDVNRIDSKNLVSYRPIVVEPPVRPKNHWVRAGPNDRVERIALYVEKQKKNCCIIWNKRINATTVRAVSEQALCVTIRCHTARRVIARRRK